MEAETLYRNRFSRADEVRKERVWQVLVRDYLQRFVRPSDTVLDIGCGYGEFLNNIVAGKRIGVDANPAVKSHLSPEITLHIGDVTKLSFLEDASVDVAFTSNCLEHLQDKAAVEALLVEVKRVLRDGGRLVLMGPNARLVAGAYWDFWDHHIPLTERSLSEALSSKGFGIDRCIAGFVPYSTRSRLPQAPFLVRAYLRMPFMWRWFGRQFLIVTHKL